MISVFIKEILRGKTLIRTLMNLELKNHTLNGRVLDIGGGEQPSYLRFFKKSSDLNFSGIDFKSPDSSRRLDLEKDKLPLTDSSVDQVLLFNILEHIYNHRFLVSEAYRVLKSGGEALGFVPFLVPYHPDPHDYFRYTEESLKRILADAHFGRIEVKAIGSGPLAAGFNMIMSYFPGILGLLIWPGVWLGDKILLLIKPSLSKRFALGYFFKCQKY